MNCLALKLTASLLVLAFLTQVSRAQENFPESERQKAETARKRAEEKANDEAYKATLKRAPVANQKVDPWGNLRTPSTKGNK
jgi:hypothetical protein